MGMSHEALQSVVIKKHCLPDSASNMSTMGVQILLVVLGCTVLISAESPLGVGPCFEAVANTQPMLGAYMPQCDLIGWFKRKQIHASTGHSWCVTPYGKEIVNTRRGPGEGEPECEAGALGGTACFIARANSKNMPGAYMPQCTAWGAFEAKQCHGSTGYCWCVEAEGGAKIAGTEKAAWEGEPNC